MRCGDVAELLRRLQNGNGRGSGTAFASGDADALEELARTGHVEAFKDELNGSAELDRRRRNLMERMGRHPEVYAMPEGERAAFDRERSELLELAESVARREGSASLAGRRFAITYRGRTLLSELMARLPRVSGMELSDFDKEMDHLRKTLAVRAAEARQVFKLLSRDPPMRDESILRSVAIGLASTGADHAVAVSAFRAATKALAGRVLLDRAALIAETIVIGRGTPSQQVVEADAAAALELSARIGGTSTDGIDALASACLLLPWGVSDRQRLLHEAFAFRDALASRSADWAQGLPACVLAACIGLPSRVGALEGLPELHAQLVASGVSHLEAGPVSVVLGTALWGAGFDPMERFLTARSYLSRFSNEGMDVPAALLATLPVGIEESLDDLRLASAAVAVADLPGGGIESLSLGLKLLMQAAAPSTQGEPVRVARHLALPLAQGGLGRPAALAALAVLHAVSVHEVASPEAAFHPLHVHYIYG